MICKKGEKYLWLYVNIFVCYFLRTFSYMLTIYICYICEHLRVNANNAQIFVCCSGEHHWCYERNRNCFGEDEKGIDKNRFLCLSNKFITENILISSKSSTTSLLNFAFSRYARFLRIWSRSNLYSDDPLFRRLIIPINFLLSSPNINGSLPHVYFN